MPISKQMSINFIVICLAPVFENRIRAENRIVNSVVERQDKGGPEKTSGANVENFTHLITQK